MRTIQAEVEIAAPPPRVWQVLTDLAAYPAWNPFLRHIRGDLHVGARLRIRAHPPGLPGFTFRPVVHTVDPPRTLRWVGWLLHPRLFQADHVFVLEPRGANHTRLIKRETFTGLLMPLTGGLLRRIERGFTMMNLALKVRVERTAE